MIDTIIGAFTKAAGDTRSVISMLVLFTVIAVSALVYDRYTGYSTFTRLEKATALAESISALDTNEDINAIRHILLQRLTTATQVDADNHSPIQATPPSRIKVTAVGFLPWIFVAFGTLLGSANSKNSGDLFLGIMMIGSILSIVCSFIPLFWWPWGHLLVMPLSPFALLILIGLIGAFKK